MKPLLCKISCLLVLFSFFGCTAFMDAFTASQARDHYNVITGVAGNFGDRRLQYIIGRCDESELSKFLERKGKPDFIYEYKSAILLSGTQLFYVKADSVYVFEELDKTCSNATLTEVRKINNFEHSIYTQFTQMKSKEARLSAN